MSGDAADASPRGERRAGRPRRMTAVGVGRLVDSSQADDRRMIRLVRARPLLYARNNMPVASCYAKVKRLWQEVAAEMGWTVADVRRKWSHVRNSYSRHLRNELVGARTGSGRAVSRWYLADELLFLREHMATDTRVSTFPAHAPPSLLHLKLAAARDEDSGGSEADEGSVYFQFFRGLHADYQELPARKQRQFRRQCLLLLHTLLDEAQDEPDYLLPAPDEPERAPDEAAVLPDVPVAVNLSIVKPEPVCVIENVNGYVDS